MRKAVEADESVGGSVAFSSNQQRPRSGAFEVTANGKVLWSKLDSARFPTADDLVELLKKFQADPSQFPDQGEVEEPSWCLLL